MTGDVQLEGRSNLIVERRGGYCKKYCKYCKKDRGRVRSGVQQQQDRPILQKQKGSSLVREKIVVPEVSQSGPHNVIDVNETIKDGGISLGT